VVRACRCREPLGRVVIDIHALAMNELLVSGNGHPNCDGYVCAL
jgi:hypothetical protein